MNDNQFENEDLKNKDDSDVHEEQENKENEETKEENSQEQNNHDENKNDSEDKKSSDKDKKDEDKKQDDKYNPFNNKRDDERRRVVGKAVKINFNFKGLLMLVFIITLAVVVPSIMDENKNQQIVDISYSDFIKNIENKKIGVVEEKDGYVYGYKASEVKYLETK